MIKLTVLCDNTVTTSLSAIGEHGFACVIETPNGNYLFDTGQGYGILHNARVLNIDLTTLSAIIMSHGHYDHAGGLASVLAVTGPIDVYAHPQFFTPRYRVKADDTRFIGVPNQQCELEALGARFQWLHAWHTLPGGVAISGEIPRVTAFERGDSGLHILQQDGQLIPDPFYDDFSLVITTGQGVVIVCGCAHAGLVNIMRHVQKTLSVKEIYAVIGGTHLAAVDDHQFQATVAALNSYHVQVVAAGHCTGQRRSAALHHLFGDKFVTAVGSRITFPLTSVERPA
jgi:7,8-dihydropterin-6-yl-methyl-4-(beta-D-ribofuranosyl)aminobenzene 5'-phosphate synthase